MVWLMIKTQPRWLTDSETRLWNAFVETDARLNRFVAKQLSDEGAVGQVQFEILSRLAEVPGGVRRMNELADALITSPSGLSYQVTQLEKAGLVTRTPASDDQRGIDVGLTQAGRRVLQRTTPGHVAAVREAFLGQLDASERKALITIFERLRSHLTLLEAEQ
jgi:DNA-binding MarR family transcriptional regulator